MYCWVYPVPQPCNGSTLACKPELSGLFSKIILKNSSSTGNGTRVVWLPSKCAAITPRELVGELINTIKSKFSCTNSFLFSVLLFNQFYWYKIVLQSYGNFKNQPKYRKSQSGFLSHCARKIEKTCKDWVLYIVYIEFYIYLRWN